MAVKMMLCQTVNCFVELSIISIAHQPQAAGTRVIDLQALLICLIWYHPQQIRGRVLEKGKTLGYSQYAAQVAKILLRPI